MDRANIANTDVSIASITNIRCREIVGIIDYRGGVVGNIIINNSRGILADILPNAEGELVCPPPISGFLADGPP